MPIRHSAPLTLSPELELIATAAPDRLRADTGGDRATGAEARRRLVDAASQALAGGVPLGKVAAAERVGRDRMRQEPADELLRRVDRAATQTRSRPRARPRPSPPPHAPGFPIGKSLSAQTSTTAPSRPSSTAPPWPADYAPRFPGERVRHRPRRPAGRVDPYGSTRHDRTTPRVVRSATCGPAEPQALRRCPAERNDFGRTRR